MFSFYACVQISCPIFVRHSAVSEREELPHRYSVCIAVLNTLTCFPYSREEQAFFSISLATRDCSENEFSSGTPAEEEEEDAGSSLNQIEFLRIACRRVATLNTLSVNILCAKID